MNQLEYHHSTRRHSFDLDLPLSDDTDNSEAVASLVEGILGGIDDLTANEVISDRDVVQALSIATAVRATVVNLSQRSGRRIGLDLLDIEVADEA
jgi:hypothetical protein